MLRNQQAARFDEMLTPLYPAPVSSLHDTVLGYPALSEEAMGWLAYMNRKVELDGTWSKDGKPHEAWDNVSGAPVQNLYRYDLTYGSFAVAMMAELTPAWREGYSKILGFLVDRYFARALDCLGAVAVSSSCARCGGRSQLAVLYSASSD